MCATYSEELNTPKTAGLTARLKALSSACVSNPKPTDRAKRYYFCWNFLDSLDDDDDDDDDDDMIVSKVAFRRRSVCRDKWFDKFYESWAVKIHMCHRELTGTGPKLMSWRRCHEKNCVGLCSVWSPQWPDHLPHHVMRPVNFAAAGRHSNHSLSQYLTNLMHKICFTISFISCLYMFRALIVKPILCIKLVKYRDKYTEMQHGQQNVKIAVMICQQDGASLHCHDAVTC